MAETPLSLLMKAKFQKFRTAAKLVEKLGVNTASRRYPGDMQRGFSAGLDRQLPCGCFPGDPKQQLAVFGRIVGEIPTSAPHPALRFPVRVDDTHYKALSGPANRIRNSEKVAMMPVY